MNPLRALLVNFSRMPPAVMFLLIIGLAVVVTMMVTGKLNENEKALDAQKAAFEQKANAKGRVVYAVKDIPEGTAISADALEDREIEQSKIPQDAITSGNLATGRIAKFGIATGQIVSQHDLAPQGISLGFEARLKNGMRAITFGVDNNSGVAGFVAPESHVDIIAMVGSGAETKAQAILSDVEIIAVGQLYQKAPGTATAVPASSVTVAVSPEDATKLIKGILAGKLYLTLRNDKDHTPVPTVDITALFAKPPSAESKLAALPPPGALPPPPIPGAPDFGGPGGMPGAMPSAPPPPPPLTEVEVWSGSRKDVLSAPKG
jgi:pilus assembly protein CpaB